MARDNDVRKDMMNFPQRIPKEIIPRGDFLPTNPEHSVGAPHRRRKSAAQILGNQWKILSKLVLVRCKKTA
jgi:hypothetical protein